MSYVIGIKRKNIAAIICDTRVSFGSSGMDGVNSALKSGLLFPGCIYGGAGNADNLRIFIQACRLKLKGSYSLNKFWEKFNSFVVSYNFPDKDHFSLIISSRHTGNPQLYSLASNNSKITKVGDLITIGSGKAILDEELHKINSGRVPQVSKGIADKNIPDFFYPFIYCLCLIEKSQGFESSILQGHGVGGIFHYTFQTGAMESRQHPSLYVLSEADYEKKIIYSYLYRVAFVETALVVDCPIQNVRDVICDSIDSPILGQYTPKEKWEYLKKINELANKQPFYNSCGFGFINPTRRNSIGFHFTNVNNYMVKKNGEINAEFERAIRANFSKQGTLPRINKPQRDCLQ